MSKTYIYNEKLKHARNLRGWSQEEFARRVGNLAESMGHQGVVLDVSTISRWERGRNSPTPFYRQLLCSLFEMNAEELGLLSLDSLPQENTLDLRAFGSPEMPFDENMQPLAVPYNRDGPTFSRQDDPYQDLHTVETSPSGSVPHFPFVRRRNLLLVLLAGATLGGGLAVKQLFFSSSPDPEPVTLSRHWPIIIPDTHKKLACVRVIQWMLNAHSGYVHINGIFAAETENAVIIFQENTHISVTGMVSSSTWEQLILPSGMTDHQQIVDQGSHVKALQEILNSFGASPQLDVDGEFGPLTEAATKHFQQTHHILVTGKADLNTWCVLVGGSLN